MEARNAALRSRCGRLRLGDFPDDGIDESGYAVALHSSQEEVGVQSSQEEVAAHSEEVGDVDEESAQSRGKAAESVGSKGAEATYEAVKSFVRDLRSEVLSLTFDCKIRWSHDSSLGTSRIAVSNNEVSGDYDGEKRPVIRFSNSYFSKVLARNVAKIKLAVDDEDYSGKEESV